MRGRDKRLVYLPGACCKLQNTVQTSDTRRTTRSCTGTTSAVFVCCVLFSHASMPSWLTVDGRPTLPKHVGLISTPVQCSNPTPQSTGRPHYASWRNILVARAIPGIRIRSCLARCSTQQSFCSLKFAILASRVKRAIVSKLNGNRLLSMD
jgi:hypothetical protein